MESRRDFFKKAMLMAAGGSLAGVLPASIQRAFAIDPPEGSTWADAEHIVILMQENRSFDHAYGSLQGVRGFNDPRAITLPNGNPVWLQSNAAGETYSPFRLDIKETKATWMGSLPHGWSDQGGARNHGKHNRWLDEKQNGIKEYAHVPLTLGYYTRQDIPFYYALADAFTICDQNFCSSLTPTTPNRLHLWTGTIRPEQKMEATAHVHNDQSDYDSEVSWKTFPERLEENGVSWRIYQNEISLPSGLEDEFDKWLTNFGDNPIEYFTQYHVRFSASYRKFLEQRVQQLTAEIASLQSQAGTASPETEKEIAKKRKELEKDRAEMEKWSAANFDALSPKEKNLHRKAFTVNEADPNFRRLDWLTYQDGAKEEKMQVPAGDLFHQFRQDVLSGKLPTVSWLVPPERFSDHPTSPWYGAWYFSETFDILTQNPEVWKKTIFILCYDENDGYFDHVPPFVPPHPHRPDTGKASAGVDVSLEHVPESQQNPSGPIGLGFRVPLLIASPWSRGGYVCSEVFDHTSILMFLEKFLGQKTSTPIRETNISSWRRTVCGDLTSVFRPYHGEKIAVPEPVHRNEFLSSIHEARHKPEPVTYRKWSDDEVKQFRTDPAASSSRLPKQEKGTRASCPLPYDLAVDGGLSADRKSLSLRFSAGKNTFTKLVSAGAPFHVYAPVIWQGESEPGRTWDYAVATGDSLTDEWALADFANGLYHLRGHGPNGFFREFHGNANDPALDITLSPLPSGNALLRVKNSDPASPVEIWIDDLSYGKPRKIMKLSRESAEASVELDLAGSFSWYDFRLAVGGQDAYWRRFSGRIETGREGVTDPAMAKMTA